MILRRERRYTVKMGDYETYSFGAAVEMSHVDLGIGEAEVIGMGPDEYERWRDELTAAVLEELHEQLVEEINEIAGLTEHRKSFLLKLVRASTATSAKAVAKKSTAKAVAKKSTARPRPKPKPNTRAMESPYA